MTKTILATIAFLITGMVPPADPENITAQSLPAITEPSWSFTDAGNTYLIGKSTGRVVVIRGTQPAPIPTPDGRPKPPPIPPIIDSIPGVKWFSVIVDPNSPEQAAWRTDPALRKALELHGVEFRTYLATEQDIDTLGFRATVTATGTPCVILQDQSGRPIRSSSPKSLAEIQAIVDMIK